MDEAATEPTPAPPRRRRRVLVAVLLTLATVIGLFAMLSVWVNRQALDTDAWADTSGKLLANQEIQTAVSAFMVDELFSNVDVSNELQKVLPPQLAPLAGPAAAGLQQVAGQLAPRLLAAPKVQQAWVFANRTAHAELMTILKGGGEVVSTTNGKVVLNLHPLVDSLAQRLGVESQVAAARSKLQGSTGATARSLAQQKLGVTLPPASGQIEIMNSKDLALAQDVALTVRDLAIVLTGLTLLLFALAVYLAVGWRRVALRSTGWCFIGLGLFVLIVRRVAGNRVVDGLVTADSVRPAAHAAFTIGTTLLYTIAIAMFVYGVAFVIAAWLGGATRPATALRRGLAPALRYRLASVYGVVALLFLLVLAWGPTPALRKPLGLLLLAALAVLGVEVLRRQVAREHPDVQPGDTGERVRAWFSGAWGRVSGTAASARAGAGRIGSRSTESPEPPAPAPATAAAGRFDALEQLAALHDRGVLDDEEFAAQKSLILSGS